LLVGAVTLSRARHDPGGSFGGASTGGALAELGGGWSLVAAGVLLAGRRAPRVSWLFAAAGVLWFAREWSNPAIGSAAAFTAGNILFLACVPLVAHAALAFPAGRLGGRGAVAAVLAAYVGAIVVLGVLATMVFDPSRVGCADCPRNVALLHASTKLYDSLNRWGLLLGLASIAALVLAIGRRLATQRFAASAPVLAAAALYLAAVAWELAHGLSPGVLGNDATALMIWRMEAGCLVAVFAGVVWSVNRGSRARAEVARLVLELAEASETESVQGILRTELRDASLTLAYRRPDREGYVDASGAPVTVRPSPAQVATPLRRGRSDVGVIVHDARLLERPGLVADAVAAARLALANEQLQAEVRAQLTELVASRARIVAAGDAERRRLERDLHDGAQQRLVGLLIGLQLLQSELGGVNDEAARDIEGIRAHVNEALDELREIAHGLYPAVLADDGLPAALQMLAERSSGRVRIRAVVTERLTRLAEHAAYFVATEAAARSSRATVSAELRRVGDLLVEVDRHESPALSGETIQAIADRVGAVGGRVSFEGSILRAEIPCAS
jgi:signal transduction histidine kinase